MDAISQILAESRDSGRGVTIHTGAGTISLVVTAVDDGVVTGRNRSASRIAVRLAAIAAVELSG